MLADRFGAYEGQDGWDCIRLRSPRPSGRRSAGLLVPAQLLVLAVLVPAASRSGLVAHVHCRDAMRRMLRARYGLEACFVSIRMVVMRKPCVRQVECSCVVLCS